MKNGMQEWQENYNKSLAGGPENGSPAALRTEIERALALLRIICDADRNYEVFDCPGGGSIRIELQRIINR